MKDCSICKLSKQAAVECCTANYKEFLKREKIYKTLYAGILALKDLQLPKSDSESKVSFLISKDSPEKDIIEDIKFAMEPVYYDPTSEMFL